MGTRSRWSTLTAVAAGAAVLSGCGAAMASIPDEAWPQVASLARSVCGPFEAGDPVETGRSESFGAALLITVTYRCPADGAPAVQDIPALVQAAGGGTMDVSAMHDGFWQAVSGDPQAYWQYLTVSDDAPRPGEPREREVSVDVRTGCSVGDLAC